MISARLATWDKGNDTRLLRCVILVWVCLIGLTELCAAEGKLCVPCPRGCDCGEESAGSGSCLVDCGQRNLLDFPQFLPQPHTSISTLIIKENVIEEIPRNAFDNLTNLVMIDASNNVIPNLPDYSFLNLTNLEELNLLGNRLSVLNPVVFAGLVNLKVLILTRNRFVHLPRGVFDELPSLEILAINVMYLKTIEGRMFEANPHLQELYMNKLSLETLPVDLYSGLNQLTNLELSVNSLTTLPEGVFDDLTDLKYLSLSLNPWSCDCELFWLTAWIRTRQASGLSLVHEDKTVCHSPQFFLSQTITSLTRENLNCSLLSIFDNKPVDQLKQLHKPDSSGPKPDRSVRSAPSIRQLLPSLFQNSWNQFCRIVGKNIPSCTGPDIFISCGPTPGGDLKPVEFSEASYQTSLSICKTECFRTGLTYATLHSKKVCLCGTLLKRTCPQTCDPKPTDYQTFCGKYYLPQTFLVSADISLAAVDIISTSSTTQFTASTNLPVDLYNWDFGTGVNKTSSSGSVQFSYFYPGDYQLTVTVTAGFGTESDKIPVRVRDEQPTVNLVCKSPMDVTESANISLTISSGYDLKSSWFQQDESGITKKGVPCDGKWLSHRGRCILALTSQKNYSDAHRVCHGYQGKLLSLNFQEEIKQVIDLLHLSSSSLPSYLIGAVRSTTTGTFVWTISNKPAYIINNQLLKSTQGNCVTLSTAGFTSVKCDTPRPFICQKDPVDCAHGGRVGPDGYCYVLSDSPAIWDIAKTNCEQFPDGALAITDSDNVHRFVSYVVLDTSNVTEAWIGLNDKEHEGHFSWTDGRLQDDDDDSLDDDDSDDDSSVSSTKWSATHSGLGDPDQKDCVMLQKEGTTYTWLENECSKDKHYICTYSNHGDMITVGSYGAGTLVFSGTFEAPIKLTTLGNLPSTPPSLITLLPGLWFSGSGKLDSWEFVTEVAPSAVYLNLLVLRPYCSSGTHLAKPGCLNNHLPYSVCQATPSSCTAVKSCSEVSQYCYLNSNCVGVREPCSCQSLSSSVHGCLSVPSAIEFSQSAPKYLAVGSVNVQLRLGKTRYHILNQSLDIKEGDVLGFQHDAASWDGILCKTDFSSKWSQSIYTWSSPGWAGTGSALTVPRNVSQSSDAVCFLRTKFYTPVITPAPPILSYVSSPGVFRYTVDVTGGLNKISETCDIIAEEKVDGLELIHPAIISTGSTAGSVGTIPIELREITTIAIRVGQGSRLKAHWKHLGGSAKFDFSATCPGSLSVIPECQRDTSLAAKPFSSISLRLDTTSPMSSLKVTVENDISSSALLVDLAKAFRIHGLKVSLSSTQKQITDSSGVVYVPANTLVNFRTTLIQGSSVTYKWSVDGVENFTSNRNNRFQFIFSTIGEHVVQVNASNVINKEMNRMHITAVQEALFKNLTPLDFYETVERGKIVNMSFAVGVMIGANVTMEVNFGDVSVNRVKSVVTRSQIIKELVSHMYQQPGQYQINVTFSDLFQSVSLVRNITVINALTSLSITSTESVIAISTLATFHVIVTGKDIGDIWHTWNFKDGLARMNYTGANTLVRHKFNQPGSYSVLVTVFNDVSSLSETINITVEEEIAGLTLTYDGPKASYLPIQFTISLNTGTNVMLNISTGDGNTTNTNLLSFSHLYRSSGVFNVSVYAWNPVSNVGITLSVYALGADMLEVVDILAPRCSVSGTLVNLTAEVINTAPVSLYYKWQFGDNTSYNSKDKPSTEHRFTSPGQYKVKVFVNNTVKAKTASTEVCIQAKIDGLQLKSPSPIGYFEGSTVDALAIATIKSGTNVTYTWEIETGSTGSIIVCNECEQTTFTYSFNHAGEYMVSVTASNNVSSKSARSRIRVQENIESVTLICTNCKESKYLASDGTVAELELSAKSVHGSSRTYSWRIDSEKPVISVGNRYKASLAEIRTYTVMVVVSNDVDSVNDSLTIMVEESIIDLYIKVNSTDVLVGSSLTFHAEYSHGTDLTFNWFVCAGCDTGNTSLTTYTHLYKSIGEFDVVLVAKNHVSEAHASIKTLCMNTIRDVLIQSNLSKNFVPTNQVVSFNVSLEQQIRVNLTWSIQMNNVPLLTETGWDVFYNFPVVGRYTVAVSAMNRLSSGYAEIGLIAEDKILDLTVNAEKNIVGVSEAVNVTAERKTGSNVLYEWSISNSSGIWVLPLSADLVTVKFTSVGVQTVTCETYNNVSDVTESVQVVVQVPIINVTIEGIHTGIVKSGQRIIFIGRVLEGSDLSFEWSLNDSNVQTTVNPQFTHTFMVAGKFLLSLKVYNDISSQLTEETIVVQEMLTELSIKTASTFVKTNIPVDFYPEYTMGSDLQFLWIFQASGGEKTALGDNVTHTYLSTGVFSVKLTANNNISSGTAKVLIYAQDPVLNILMINCCGGTYQAQKPLSFKASVTGGTNVTYSQTISDRNSKVICQSEDMIILCTFPTSGRYTLKVDGENDVSHDSRIYLVSVQTALQSISVIPEGPGWDYLYQGQSVKFKVSGDGVSDATIFEWRINDVLMTTTDPELEYVFITEGSFNMTITVKNRVSSGFFTTSITVHTFLCQLPALEAVGDTTRLSSPSIDLEFEVSVDSKNCNYYEAIHQWKVFSEMCSGSYSGPLELPVSVYTSSPLLKLPKHVLPSGVYCVKFSTGYKETALRESLMFNLTLEPSPLIAIIKGGNDILLPFSEPVTLDGSVSYDPDSNITNDTHMNFVWTCHFTSYQASLPLPCFRRKFGKIVHIPQGILLPGYLYSIGLTLSTVTCTPEGDCRNGTAVQNIKISPVAVPTVDVDCVSCRVTNNFQISSNQHVALKGNCRNCSNSDDVQYSWTVTKLGSSAVANHLELNSTTTTTGANASDLVIRRGILQDGHAYTFKLEVTKSLGSAPVKGKASLTLQPNLPPYPGSCTLYPTNNKVVPLTTLVTVVCDGWMDAGSKSSDLRYHISLERTLPSGAVDQCVLYHGARRNHSLYLSHWPDQAGSNIVSIRVDVQDEKKACTLALKRNIELLSPVLMKNQSLSEHIVETALKQLKSLVQLHRPSTLLQYSMAVLMELNRASQMGDNSAENLSRRTLLRLAITNALYNTPIQSVQDIQQLAYAMEQITMYKTEFNSPRYQIVLGHLFKRVVDTVHNSVKQGLDSEDFAPVHLLAALSNLIRSVDDISTSSSTIKEQTPINLGEFKLSTTSHESEEQVRDHQWNRRVATQAVTLSQALMSYILMTKLPNEALLEVDLYDTSYIGRRLIPTSTLSVDNFRVVFPASLLSKFKNEEIFQIMSVMVRNPFVWGYEGNFVITSEVPSVLFQYQNGSEILVHSLKENIKIEMHASKHQQNNTEKAELEMANVTLQANSSKKVILDTSLADESAKVALHVRVRCTALSFNLGLNISSLCSVYLGVDYEASEQRYEEKTIISEDILGDEDNQVYTFFMGSSSFRPDSEYSLTVFNPSQDSSVEVSVGIYMSSCQYYSIANQHWETHGCEVGEKSSPQRTVCFCNHLTSFGASAIVPPNAIDFTDLGRLSLSTNPIALITCCLLLVVYILMAILCLRKDRKDIQHIAKVPLCGLDGAFKYEVTIVTGRQLGAGTSAHIGIKLYGADGKGGSRHLYKPGAFTRNSQDTFLIANDVNLGKLWRVRIWHDNSGLSPSWYLIQVVVRDLQTDRRYLFMANCWLSLQETNGFIQKEIIVSDPHQQWTFSQLCSSAFSRGLCDQHLWMSVIDRPTQSRFSRVQRLTCCFTLLYTYMAVNIMWYGAIKTSPKLAGINGWQYLSWEEIAVGTVSSLLVFPVNILIAYIFRKTRSKENMFELIEKPLTAQTVEMDADCGLSLEDGSGRGDSLRKELTDFYGRDSTEDSIIPTKGGLIRRTHTLPHLLSEDSEDSFFKTGTDSDSGVSSSRIKDHSSGSKGWWNHDSILNHWPNLPDVKSGVEFKERQTTEKSLSVNKSLRVSGIQVGDLDSDDGWSSCLDDVEQTDHSATKPEEKHDTEWSLDDIDDKEKWKHIHKEFFDDDLPKKTVKSKAEIELVDFSKTCHGDKTKTSGFNPRADASLNTGTAHRRRSLSGPSGGLSQKVQPTSSSTHNCRENSFDSVQGNILFGRERDRTMSSISTRRGNARDRRMSVASRLSQKLNRVLLPRWCLLVAYGMCLMLCGVSVLLILLYANQLGALGTWRWIVSLVLSFLLSVLLTEPLKVLFLAVFAAAVTKQVDEVEDEDAIEIQPTIESNEKLKDVKFRPLGGYALMNAKDEAKKLNRMYAVVRQFLAYFSLLWLVVVLAHFHYNSDLYRLNQRVRSHYTKTTFNDSQTFKSIDSIPTFWQWCEEVLVPSFSLMESENNLYIGPVRMKQIRNKPVSCPAADQLSAYSVTEGWTEHCDSITGFTEDVEPYLTRNGTEWQYYTAQQLDEYGVWLYSGWYSGGGYLQTISPHNNYSDHLLSNLQNISWIDHRTRAVFIELTVHNPAVDVLCMVHLTLEFPFTGKAVSSIETQSFHLLKFSPGYVDAVMIFQILLLLVFLYLLVQCGLTLRDRGLSALLSHSVWLDILIVIFMLSSLILYIICVTTSTNAVQRYLNDTSQFISFKKTAYLHSWCRQSNAGLLFLVFLKVVQQLRFSKHLSLFQKTISRALGDILRIGLIFLVLLCSYGQLGYLIYGSTVYGFHTFQSSVLSLVGVIRGHVNFEPLLRLTPAFSYVFFYSLVISVYGTLFCLITSVLRGSYKLTHSQMFYIHTRDTQDYEIIEFMLKRFKQLAGFTQPKAAFRRVRFAGLPSLSTRSTVSFPSSDIPSQASSSIESYDVDALDSNEDSSLDQLPARWEDVLMKIRQLEEMDKHEDYFSEQLSTVFKKKELKVEHHTVFKKKELKVEHQSSDLSIKPPKAPRLRSMSDSKMKLFKKPGSKSGRKSVSPPSATKQQTLARRPYSDQGARFNAEDQKIGFFSRFFKKAW